MFAPFNSFAELEMFFRRMTLISTVLTWFSDPEDREKTDKKPQKDQISELNSAGAG